jgi:hypothetical protein
MVDLGCGQKAVQTTSAFPTWARSSERAFFRHYRDIRQLSELFLAWLIGGDIEAVCRASQIRFVRFRILICSEIAPQITD